MMLCVMMLCLLCLKLCCECTVVWQAKGCVFTKTRERLCSVDQGCATCTRAEIAPPKAPSKGAPKPCAVPSCPDPAGGMRVACGSCGLAAHVTCAQRADSGGWHLAMRCVRHSKAWRLVNPTRAELLARILVSCCSQVHQGTSKEGPAFEVLCPCRPGGCLGHLQLASNGKYIGVADGDGGPNLLAVGCQLQMADGTGGSGGDGASSSSGNGGGASSSSGHGGGTSSSSALACGASSSSGHGFTAIDLFCGPSAGKA
jgi:hypothetical protein